MVTAPFPIIASVPVVFNHWPSYMCLEGLKSLPTLEASFFSAVMAMFSQSKLGHCFLTNMQNMPPPNMPRA